MKKHLFLFGGSPPFGPKLGKLFASYAQGPNGKVAILFLERDGWQHYMPRYTSILAKNKLTNFLFLALPTSDSSMIEELRSCTGIIIGGGETINYHKEIIGTILGQLIKEMYDQVIPVAGFSAGALISPLHCIIPPIDNPFNKHLFLDGLGLLQEYVISVHYSRWNEEKNLKTAVDRLPVSGGIGIDDDEGLYFENETLINSEGNNYVVVEKR